MESCGYSQHWARRLSEMGHQVKLMTGRFVKAFVCGALLSPYRQSPRRTSRISG